MKLLTWNVNGMRALLKKDALKPAAALLPDVISIQETKMQEGQAAADLPGYEEYFCSAERKGYSGTAVFTRPEPISVRKNFGVHTDEGRMITVDYGSFYLVNVYTPNAQPGLARIDYRMAWEDDLRGYLLGLDKEKPVILCGDLNVAHEEIDLKNPGPNRGNAGFSDEERGKMTELLDAGFVDAFRYLYPDKTGAYSWWSYRFHARDTNAGWRIDYFIVSDRLKERIRDVIIHSEIFGSDHCPVELDIDLEPEQ